MYDIPFDRLFLQLSNGIRHVMPSTDPKPELTAKASMAQPVSQPAVYAKGLMIIRGRPRRLKLVLMIYALYTHFILTHSCSLSLSLSLTHTHTHAIQLNFTNIITMQVSVK
jgi:hypothetical protein